MKKIRKQTVRKPTAAENAVGLKFHVEAVAVPSAPLPALDPPAQQEK